MPSLKDIAGFRFGRVVAIRLVGRNRHRKAIWRCACDCGQEFDAISGNLTSGTTMSCGCLKLEIIGRLASRRNRRHGHATGGAVSSEYCSWRSMINRCKHSCVNGFKYYGGRGVTVCERWQSFEAFLADMGEKPTPKHTLDRIDPDGSYTPENCRWATSSQQRRNQRRSQHNEAA